MGCVRWAKMRRKLSGTRKQSDLVVAAPRSITAVQLVAALRARFVYVCPIFLFTCSRDRTLF